MISGDVGKVTDVVREVWRPEQDTGISAG